MGRLVIGYSSFPMYSFTNRLSYQTSSFSPSMMDDLPLRFLADCMLGRLTKWLRLLGYDTAYDNVATDHELARRARAESWVLLTRDLDLAARRGLRTLLIRSEVLEKQVQEVQDAFEPLPGLAFSCCSVCNLVLERASPAEVADRLPPVDEFTGRAATSRRCAT